MKIWLLAVLLFCSQLVRADKVDGYVREQMKKGSIPGVAVTVIKDGKRVKTGLYGFSNLELKTSVTKDSVFEIGALTKQFTAAGILLLVQEGKVSLEAPISQYLTNTPAAWSSITVRHLLNHTSGIKSFTDQPGFELSKHLTQQQFLENLAILPLEFRPGEQFKYGNTGFILLGYIIENVSGKSYWEFMNERLFAPLKMRTTTNREPATVMAGRANGYERSKSGGLVNRDYNLTELFSTGGLVSTLEDMVKWDAALAENKVLSAATKELMWNPTRLKDGTMKHYGFGWGVETNGRRNVGHSGYTSGFTSSYQLYPDDKLSIIVLCNLGEESLATILADGIAKFYLPEVKVGK
ncbi:serine hydrolase domain-containing protein [Pedosphaera parvula]|uniref:Beta-lactamase n=1 Tax=Pedosphaera parvula (strain Ellin514) TaxID=320771 RepID=B9XCN8_PEDPL|nr:serine hydrolase domain-containing protein [Pedosphaera parvula]EEF62234.1 beta-lactamase [Pedosphaera parvula Ellin514]